MYIYRREYKKTLDALRRAAALFAEKAEVAVRKSIYEGAAYALAQRYDNSEKSFERALQLAQEDHPELLVEVLNNQGVVQSDEKKYEAAAATFERALQLARANRNQRQELFAMVSLGAANLYRERFDEALDWDQRGLKLAAETGRQETARLITGNMGASYFALGDFENAEPLFRQAADADGKQRLYDSQAHWLMALAECYYAEQDYAKAQEILEEGLRIARPLEEKTALTECLNDLASTALETGNIEAADKYNKEEGDRDAGLDRSAMVESNRYEDALRKQRDIKPIFARRDHSLRKRVGHWNGAQARLAKTLDDAGNTKTAEKRTRRRSRRSSRRAQEEGERSLSLVF